MLAENFQELIDYSKKKLEQDVFDEFEISCVKRLESLTRFANSSIHQNVSDHSLKLLFRASKEKKVCSSSLTSLTKTSIDSTIKQMRSMLEFVPDIPFFQGFIEETERRNIGVEATGTLLDEYQRAEIVSMAVSTAEEVDKSVKLAGTVFTTALEFRIINSNGLDTAHSLSYNGMSINALTEREHKGYAKENQIVRNAEQLKPIELAQKATELSLSTCFAKDYPEGDYEVILSPNATATLIRFLAIGFSANAYHDSQSIITDQIGSLLFDEKLTLLDDPLDPNTILASPFDGEGVQKNPYFIVENGVPKTIIYNSFMASRYLNDKSRSTGHQLIPFSDYVFNFVMPTNLKMQEGDSSEEEMIEETKKGFFINRLHYTNFVNRKLGAITGLT
ncbi:MAG: TldD/PmbA family protein, partial [Candidatus Heimdallarchaeaceae archaeon]